MLKSKKFIYAAVGFCMILAGVFYFLHNSSVRDSTEYYYSEPDFTDAMETEDFSYHAGNMPSDSLSESGMCIAETVCVYVCGAVRSPGVYYCESGSRIADAVGMAGGPEDDACPEELNLAQQVSDGQKIYVPREGETIQQTAAYASPGNNPALVNINTAGEAELTTLPGIGQSRAGDIIAYREENGGFRNVEEIMNVPGIKEASYEKIKDLICI